uniref:Uncharacterized protein n=1 Tax=Peronospora matthiolae TaxID=2874970 RepID=A0AAV1UZG6_9STRA
MSTLSEPWIRQEGRFTPPAQRVLPMAELQHQSGNLIEVDQMNMRFLLRRRECVAQGRKRGLHLVTVLLG